MHENARIRESNAARRKERAKVTPITDLSTKGDLGDVRRLDLALPKAS